MNHPRLIGATLVAAMLFGGSAWAQGRDADPGGGGARSARDVTATRDSPPANARGGATSADTASRQTPSDDTPSRGKSAVKPATPPREVGITRPDSVTREEASPRGQSGTSGSR